MSEPRHQPQRTCIGCGAKRPQGELWRLSAPGGVVRRDRDGRAPGRGAYLCARRECVEKAWKRRAVERALRLPSGLPVELRDELLNELK